MRRYWIVNCDHKNHTENCNQAALPEGEPAGMYVGTMTRKAVTDRLIAEGWLITKRKRVCSLCVACDRELELCPECNHEWAAHNEPSYGGDYYCHYYILDEGECCCRAVRDADGAQRGARNSRLLCSGLVMEW